MKKGSGIYKIINKANGKFYIGATSDFSFRKIEHFSKLRNGKHYNSYLQRSFDKYGEENFLFEIVEECDTDIVFEKEQEYITNLDAINKEVGYNQSTIQGGFYNITIPIAKLSLEGELIEIYTSISNAAKSIDNYTKKTQDNIGDAIRGRQKTAYGFLWIKYNEKELHQEINVFLKERIGMSSLIEQIDLITGEVLNKFNGIKEAETHLGIKEGYSSIWRCLAGKYSKADGFFWRRYEYQVNRKPIAYLGSDPGAKGAISVIYKDGTRIFNFVTPLVNKKEIDIHRLVSYVNDWAGYIHTATIEDVHSIFGSSAKSNFQFGRALGILQGAIIGNQIPASLVQPKVWQKEMWQGIPIQKKASKSGKKMVTDTKSMSLMAVKRLFPDVDLRATPRCTKPHDGKVDALLMAEYSRRKF